MTELDRRQFLEVGATAALASTLAAVPAKAAGSSMGGSAQDAYKVKPLPFDPKMISGFSEKILTSHYENNYSGAVKRLNAITARLATLDWVTTSNFLINGLKREELIAANSMILHEHYFSAFVGKESAPKGKLAEAIARDFGSFDKWKAQFAAMGKAQGGGSGWVVLCYSPRDKRLINAWASDHTTNLANGRPVLVLDMYEHSYHMDFGAKAGAYVEAFMAALKWDNAVKLFDAYHRET